jgi:cell division protein FtsB
MRTRASSRPSHSAAPPAAGRKATVAMNVLGVATALLTLATGYLGFKTAQATTAKSDAQATASQSQDELAGLQKKYTALQQENDRLKAQSGATSTSSPTQAPHAASSTPGSVRHDGRITFLAGTGIDLDAPATDAKWGLGSGGTEIYLSQNGTIGAPSGSVYLGTQAADYPTCSQSTVYRGSGVDRGVALPGRWFCARSSGRRYAAVKILDNVQGQVTLQITSFDPPDTAG